MNRSLFWRIVLGTATFAFSVVVGSYLYRTRGINTHSAVPLPVQARSTTEPVGPSSAAIASAVAALMQEDHLGSAAAAEHRLMLLDGRDTSPVTGRARANSKVWNSSNFSELQGVEFEFTDVPADVSPQRRTRRFLIHRGQLQAQLPQHGSKAGSCLQDAAFRQALTDSTQFDNLCAWHPHGMPPGRFSCFERRFPDGSNWSLKLKLDDARLCVVQLTAVYEGPKANLSESLDVPDRSPVRTPTGTEVTGYAFGFSIPRYTGILEAGIERVGCNVTIDAAELHRLLVPFTGDGPRAYEARDVRAKLFPAGDTPLFIDAEGVARQGSTYYRADTKKLDQAFKVLRCPG